MSGARIAALALVAALVAGCSVSTSSTNGGKSPTDADARSSVAEPAGSPSVVEPVETPLAGKVVVLDPGHQLGNRDHGSEIRKPVDAGGFDKECNTTGAATASNYPEATFTWQVAVEVRRLLRRLGARVVLTRSSNSARLWGPCIDERGRLGNPDQPGPAADLRLSIHADGVSPGSTTGPAFGFHVIRPGFVKGWTDDIAKPSRRLAVVVRDALLDAGFPASSYRGTRGIDVRTDLGTLNHSDVPTVLVELANMRNRADAAIVESARGRRQYAAALAEAVRSYLDR